MTAIMRDERTLEWLHLRLDGWTCQEIGVRYGVGRGTVARACVRVARDDEKSGEDISGWYV